MDKRVLLVGGGKSFMVTSIAKELKEKGFAPSGFRIISEKEYVEF